MGERTNAHGLSLTTAVLFARTHAAVYPQVLDELPMLYSGLPAFYIMFENSNPTAKHRLLPPLLGFFALAASTAYALFPQLCACRATVSLGVLADLHRSLPRRHGLPLHLYAVPAPRAGRVPCLTAPGAAHSVADTVMVGAVTILSVRQLCRPETPRLAHRLAW
jgi:hypothetical protein